MEALTGLFYDVYFSAWRLGFPEAWSRDIEDGSTVYVRKSDGTIQRTKAHWTPDGFHLRHDDGKVIKG